MSKIKRLLGNRKKDTYKGDYGRVFILAGSAGMTGAAALCAQACMRAGAGLVTLGIASSLNAIMEVKLTEVMTYPLPETNKGTLSLKAKAEILKNVEDSDVVLMGPGLSTNIETQKLIRELMVSIRRPMVLDADALNAAAENTGVLKKIKSVYIVTPHAGEMARLVARDVNYVKKDRLVVAKNFSNNYNAVVVLKGYRTVVAYYGESYVNNTGNPGMATAGSGDVLTGIIAGFLAQGLKAFDAARLGVYVHGLAGDFAAKEKGETSLIASDILSKIPEAIKRADTRVAKGVRL